MVMILAMSLVTFLLFFASPADPARSLRQELHPGAHRAEPQGARLRQAAAGHTATSSRESSSAASSPRTRAEEAAPETDRPLPGTCLGYSPLTNDHVRDIIERAARSRPPWPSPPSSCGWSPVSRAGIIAALSKGQVRRPRHRRRPPCLLRLPHVLHRPGRCSSSSPSSGSSSRSPSTRRSPRVLGRGSRDLFLPALTLAAVYAAAYVRLTRAFVLETHGRGLHPHRAGQGPADRTVICKHACAPR